MVIVAPGVARDGGHFGGSRRRPIVELAYAEDGSGRRKEPARIFANGGAMIDQVAHRARVARLDPVPVKRSFGSRQGAGYAGEIEAAVERERFDVGRGNHPLQSILKHIVSLALLAGAVLQAAGFNPV